MYTNGEWTDPSAEFSGRVDAVERSGLVHLAATATTLQFVGRSEGEPEFFIGELVKDGSQLKEITCTGMYVPYLNGRGLTPNIDGAVPTDFEVRYDEPRQSGSRWLIGGWFAAPRYPGRAWASSRA